MAERYIVDEYGTVVDVIKEGEFCQIKSHKSVTKWKQAIRINYSFLKFNPEAYNYVCDKYSIFSRLIKYLTYIDCALVFENGRIIKTTHIAKMTGLNLRTVQKQIKNMSDEDIIRRVKFADGTRLIVNPWIVMKGGVVSEDVLKAFECSSWKDKAKGSVTIYDKDKT